MRLVVLKASVGWMALAAAVPLSAQTPVGEASDAAPASQAARTQVYDAAFFAAYSPRNALDIVRQVPGFQLDVGNGDIRGFAGAAGNVVINGARPSSKAESLDSLLAQIPARRVVRVEVGPGALYGSEYSGKSQVLNIILSAGGGFDATVTGSVRRRFTGLIIPNLSGSATLKRGDSTFSLSAGTENYDQTDEGTDLITDPFTGERFEKRRKLNHYRPRNPYISGSWALEQAPDKAIHLNGRFGRNTEDFVQINHVYPTGDAFRDDRLYLQLKSPGYEISGDISRPLAGGTIKLVGLANRRHRETQDTALNRIDDNVVGGFEQSTESQRNETIGRLNWTRAKLAGFSFETGAEVALNTLDSQVGLFVFGHDGEREQIDLPVDDATVREKRAELYVKAGRQIAEGVRLDAGLNYEMSELKVRGDTTADRALKFLKPSLTLDWKTKSGWHSQFTIRRTVAQLDFYDFISSAELSNSRINGGNANLQPQRAWEARASVDHPVFGKGLIKLDLGYDQISMLQDRILIFDEEGNAFDAPGNIGTGKRAFAHLTVDAPLDRFGIKGAKLKFDGTLQRTTVADPISGDKRRFTGFYPEWQWYVEFRRDIGKWAYGMAVSDRDSFDFFRSNEIDTSYNGGMYGSGFVEYRPSQRTTVTFDIDNLFNTRSLRNRLFTFPNRSFSEPSLNEVRERNQHIVFGLTFKRTFGGASKAAGVAPAN
jgi:hypothetical protein